MIGTLMQQLQLIPDGATQTVLKALFAPLMDRYSTQVQANAGLAIKAGGSAIVKTGGSATPYIVKGKGGTIDASTDMAALSGTVTQSYYNVFVFFVDSAGTLTTAMGQQATTKAAVIFPPFPAGKAVIGYIRVINTGASFIGGTTALDNGTVTVEYVNTPAPWDPTVLTGL